MARRLCAEVPAGPWDEDADWYLETYQCWGAVAVYLDYFFTQQRALPVDLYFELIDLIEAEAEPHKRSKVWKQVTRDGQTQILRPSIRP